MSIFRRASVPAAFLVGLSGPALIGMARIVGVDTTIGQVLMAVGLFAYCGLMFYFVFGPQRWAILTFVPEDGTGVVLLRCAAWLVGSLISVAALDSFGAI